MQGSILPCRGSVCEHCSTGKYVKTKSIVFKMQIPSCNKCGEMPKKLRVRKTVPDELGNGKKVDFYYNTSGDRLDDVVDCVSLIKQINEDLKNGTFQLKKYKNPQEQSVLFFENFYLKYIEYQEKRTLLPEEDANSLSPNGLRLKKSHGKHLIKKFQGIRLDQITKYRISEYYKEWDDRFRTRDLVVAELRYMLNYAWAEMGLINSVPPFPKLQGSRIRSPDEIPSIEIQKLIIEEITSPTYKAMSILMAIFTLRPCEVRALRKKDFVYIDSSWKMIISHHFSGNTERRGRKSVAPNKKMGVMEFTLDSEVINFLMPFISSCEADEEYIFKGMYKEFVNSQNINRAWRIGLEKAQKKYKKENPLVSINHPIFKKYNLSVGTRHATLSEARKRYDLVALMNLSGHTNVVTLTRYAQIRDGELEKMVKSERFFGKGVQNTGVHKVCKHSDSVTSC